MSEVYLGPYNFFFFSIGKTVLLFVFAKRKRCGKLNRVNNFKSVRALASYKKEGERNFSIFRFSFTFAGVIQYLHIVISLSIPHTLHFTRENVVLSLTLAILSADQIKACES